MTVEERFLAELRADPRLDPKRVAREVGISGRAARRLVAQLEGEGVLHSRRRRRSVLAALGLGGLALAALAVWREVPDAPDEPTARVLPPEAKAKERELYRALDRRDPARTAMAKVELESQEDVVRLAALRYLASVDVEANAPVLLPLFDDPSERIRPVALQLVGRVPGRAVEDALLAVVLDANRQQSDRMLALAGLRDRPHSLSLAPALLPVLLDPAPALREQTAALLTRLTRKSIEPSPADPRSLHAAWRDALGVSE